ncbi:MBL fold metallo-hydrolase [Halovulum sp. GXIMD14793]
MSKLLLSRRKALLGGAMLPVAGLSAGAARAKAPIMGASTPSFNRFQVGEFDVVTLLDSTQPVESPQSIFGLNVSEEEFAAVSDAALIPTTVTQFFFTPTLVNNGEELVLFDTGYGPGLVSALAAAGYTPDQIDKVVLTHMHGDHISGLNLDGAVTYPNATYICGAAEDNHWSKAENQGYEAKVRPIREKMTFINDGDEVATGITAMAAFGHTPGHMTYLVDDFGEQLLIAGDIANHYVWSLAYPDWEVGFDMDKTAAAAARRKVFGMLAAERIPFIGYHMPFPGLGYVASEGDGFRYIPSSYQHML